MTGYIIREAQGRDVPGVLELLRQVLKVHNAGRPDLFASEGGKYSREELLKIFANPQTPVFVLVDSGDSGTPGPAKVPEAPRTPGLAEASKDPGNPGPAKVPENPGNPATPGPAKVPEAPGNPGTPGPAGAQGGKDRGGVKGYVFCRIEEHSSRSEAPHRTLYIDDLCVDENCRGQHFGRALYMKAVEFGRETGCYNLTLHVWECNPRARAFYDAMGLQPQYAALEKIL